MPEMNKRNEGRETKTVNVEGGLRAPPEPHPWKKSAKSVPGVPEGT